MPMRSRATFIMMARGRALCIALLLCGSPAASAAEPLRGSASEPRAFGYQVGDLVSRSVSVEVPEGLVLDESSVPRPGVRGHALELRSVERRSRPGRDEFTLGYQVFLSPPQPRTLEMPGFHLRYRGPPRDQELLVEAWPVTVAPLVPQDVSPRRGLGELQPDDAPPQIDTRWRRWRLFAYGAAALLFAACLAQVYIGLPWWRRARHRPFAQAWRALRGLDPDSPDDARWRIAFQRLHDALNRTLGEVVFEQGIEHFVRARPRFAHLGGELARFFEQSRLVFFVGQSSSVEARRWLIEFSRRCRDAERGMS